MRTRSIERQKRIAVEKEKNGRDLETVKALIKASFDIARDPSNLETYRAGRAALKAAFGHEYFVHRDDLLKVLLASAISFSNEA